MMSSRDFAPIAAVSDAPVVLATNGASPYKTVADVIAAAKAQPETLNVGTPGYGSINQLILESIALNTGTKFVHVPYKGGAPAAQALVAGDIPLGVLASSSVAPFVPNGSIRVLAVTAAQRSPLNPEWPTLQEQGRRRHQCVELDRASGAARRAAADHRQAQSAEVVEILNMPDVKAALRRRRRLDHSFQSGRACRQDQARAGGLSHRSSRRPMFTSTEAGKRRDVSVIDFFRARRKAKRPVRGIHQRYVQANPDCQSRRDRLPHHQDRAPDGHRDRRGLFRSRPQRAPCRDGRRGDR